jgi:hypothetical protein
MISSEDEDVLLGCAVTDGRECAGGLTGFTDLINDPPPFPENDDCFGHSRKLLIYCSRLVCPRTNSSKKAGREGHCPRAKRSRCCPLEPSSSTVSGTRASPLKNKQDEGGSFALDSVEHW